MDRDDTVLEQLADPAARADPYPIYHGLQEAGPVFYEPLRAWLVTRHEDVVAILRHPAASSLRGNARFRALKDSGRGRLFPRMEALSMLNRDPPDHTRLRKLVNKAFTPRMVARFRPSIQAVADELIGAVAARGEMELVAEFAYPFPLVVISDLIGVPAADRHLITKWAADLAERFGVDPRRNREARRRGDQAAAEMYPYFASLVESRRAEPRDDLLTSLVQASDGDDRLTEEELVANCGLLLNAGHETTANLIANATVALLRAPDQMARVRDDPDVLRTAVEEVLRYDSSIQLTPRIMLEDVTVSRTVIRAGQRVFLLLGAANRDGRVFDDPDRLDVGRVDNPHLSFGSGIHFCIGAGLARAEIEIALATLVARCPGLALASEELTWRSGLTLRGPERVPVRWTPAVTPNR